MKNRFKIFYAPDDAGGSAPGGTPPAAAPASSSILNSQTQNPQPAAQTGGGATTPPPAAVSFKEIVGEGGVLHDKWTDVLPEDIRNDPGFRGIKTIDAMAKSYLSAKKLVGAEKIALPGKHSTPDEINAFQMKLGRPETAEKYQFQKPENLPANAPWSDDGVKAFQGEAFKLGISQKQFEGLVNWHTASSVAALQAKEQAEQQADVETVQELQKDWGNAFNQQLNKAQRVANMFGGIERFEKLGVASKGDFLKFMSEIGSRIGEDKILGADDPIVPSSAIQKIEEITSDKNHAYWKLDHPGHAAAVREMERLNAQAYPEKKG